MKSEEAAPPLVFVYLGNPPPTYARDSMIFASKGHDGRIILLTDVDHSIAADRRYEVQRIDDWYDPTKFEGFRANASLDSNAMGGFWFHVVERFFVLHQFMEREGLHSLFHAELDVLVINLDGVSEACDAHGSGIFAVMDDRTRALASLFYANSSTKFSHFLRFAARDLSMKNEMAMIATYFQKHPENGHALPSSPFFESGRPQLAPSVVSDEIGLFDAAAFGQWLFGVDTKLVKYASRNHFRNETVRFPIEELRFQAPLFGREFKVELDRGMSRKLRTLHIHSKIIARLRTRPILIFYFLVSRLVRPVVITRRPGWWAARLLEMVFAPRVWFVVKNFTGGTSNPLMTIILALARRSAFEMPNRQRALLTAQLPRAPLGSRGAGVKAIWLLADRSTNGEIDQALAYLAQSNSPLSVQVITSARSPQIVRTAQKRGSSAVVLSRGNFATELAREVFKSDEDTICLLRPSVTKNFGRTLFDNGGCQLLVVADTKADPASRQWKYSSDFPRLRTELSFSSRILVLKPKIFRELFQGDESRINAFFGDSDDATGVDKLAQLYGCWMWTFHRPKVVLGRES